MSRFMASKGLLHADEVAARSRTEERRAAGRMAAMCVCEVACSGGRRSMRSLSLGEVDECDCEAVVSYWLARDSRGPWTWTRGAQMSKWLSYERAWTNNKASECRIRGEIKVNRGRVLGGDRQK